MTVNPKVTSKLSGSPYSCIALGLRPVTGTSYQCLLCFSDIPELLRLNMLWLITFFNLVDSSLFALQCLEEKGETSQRIVIYLIILIIIWKCSWQFDDCRYDIMVFNNVICYITDILKDPLKTWLRYMKNLLLLPSKKHLHFFYSYHVTKYISDTDLHGSWSLRAAWWKRFISCPRKYIVIHAIYR